MKQILTLTFLAITHLMFGQTKKETVDWLNSKFPGNLYIYGTVFKETQVMKINTDGTFEIVANIHKQPIEGYPVIETKTRISGNLKDFSLSSVKKEEADGAPKLFFIALTCLNSKNCVTISQTGKPGPEYSKKGVAFGAFMKNEEENISERLVKAFKHLITLSGGKKESF